jgi:catechol-2,3-dioxygenase
MNFSLKRIILFVQDIKLLKNFYLHHFGLPVIEEVAGEWVVLKAGPCELALHTIGAGYEHVKTNITNTKLVFETTEDIDLLREKLLLVGVPIGEIKTFQGNPSLFCDGTDPEGNVFQLMARKV